MSWRLSRFRARDLLEVRTKEEILATLDANGCIDGMPFMPEMLQFCGARVRVGAVAHKTCDTAKRTYKGRRLESMVHLDDLRCDGSAHGGCQAACKLFWRDEWLRPANEPAGDRAALPPRPGRGRCDEETLAAKTRLPLLPGEPGPRPQPDGGERQQSAEQQRASHQWQVPMKTAARAT